MTTPNAYLTYDNVSFPLYVTSFSYPLTMESKGSSQSRHYHTLYPYRAMRGDVMVKARFRNRRDYEQFGSFIESYHESVLSGFGDSFKPMYFYSKRKTTSRTAITQYGISPSKAIYWAVTVEKITMLFGYDMDAAPEISFIMRILDDENTNLVSESSSVSGSVKDLVGKQVVWNGEISNKGDDAFSFKISTS